MNSAHPLQSAKLAYSPDELPSMLGIGRNGIYELIHSGRLRSVRVGRKILVPAGAIIEFLNAPEAKQ